MRKHLLIGLSSAVLLAAPLIGGASAQAVANPPPARSEQKTAPATQPTQTGPADNQIADQVDANIAQLKARLQLTTDQDKNWSGLQSALHDFGVVQFKNRTNEELHRYGRRGREDESQASDRPNDIALMRQAADRLTAKAAALKALANAAEPLYGTLDDRQKQKLMRFMSGGLESRQR